MPRTTNSISLISWLHIAASFVCEAEIVVDAAISMPKPSSPPPASSISCIEA